MVRSAWPTICLALLILSALSGCSVRHRSLLSEVELTQYRSAAIDLEAFLELPLEKQTVRVRQAERAAIAWRAALAADERLREIFEAPAIYQGTGGRSPLLGDVIEHLETAVGLDPSRADLWFALGLLRHTAGDVRLARRSLVIAWHVADRAPERQDQLPSLRRDIAVLSAWIERDSGWWDEGLHWLDRAGSFLKDDDSEAVLLRGLLLAGRGDLEEAMRLSYGIPEAKVPVVGFSQWGLEHQRSDRLRTWLQAEVWMQRGRPDLAWHILGDPLTGRNVPLAHRYWQDIGLYAELAGDSQANDYYVKSYLRQPFRSAEGAVPLHCDPVIRGQPWRFALFYRRASGVHTGGSLFAHAASQAMLAQRAADPNRAEQLYLQALEALSVCIRRGIYRNEAFALRGELRFALGNYYLAEVDLSVARRQFAADGHTEPETSYLLGVISMGRERYGEAENLLEEAAAADSTLSGAWSALGVVRLQLGRTVEARQALDRSVAADPHSVQARYNRGLLRSQIGDLDGGLEDLTIAGRLNPQNLEVGRLIQFVQAAQREGRPFLPIEAQDDYRQSLAVDLRTRAGGERELQPKIGGEPWLHQLTSLFGDWLAESRLIALQDGFTASQLAHLQDVYHAEPNPDHRKTLAFGYAWLGHLREAQSLLAPYWGSDLDADEVLLLLWLDHRLGESARHRKLAAGLRGDVTIQIGHLQALQEFWQQFGEHQLWVDAAGGEGVSPIRAFAYAQYLERQRYMYSHSSLGLLPPQHSNVFGVDKRTRAGSGGSRIR